MDALLLGEWVANRHRDRIETYCKPENTIAFGFVEGLSNKIRVMHRRSYGLRDEEYPPLKAHHSWIGTNP